MTTVPRRAKPQPRSKPAAPVFTDTPPEPWPSYCNPAPRVTTSGKVSSVPSPIQAMWAEAVGRQQRIDALAELTYVTDESSILGGELTGLCVAIAILTCLPLEEVAAELDRRAHVSLSGSGARS